MRSRTGIGIGAPPWALGLVAIATAALALIARRPEQVLRAEFTNEDGQVFFIGTFFGGPFETLLRPHGGYLHFAPRLIAELERLVDTANAPLVGNVSALLVTLVVACYVGSHRLSDVIPNRGLRLAAGATIILLPNVSETHAAAMYTNFYLGALLLAIALARTPESRVGKVIDLLLAGIASLSGPVCVLVAPLFVARAARARDRFSVMLAGTVLVAASIQFVLTWALGRFAHVGPLEIGAIARVVTMELWALSIGATWTTVLDSLGLPVPFVLVGTAALAVLVGLTLSALPRWLAWRLAMVGVVLVALSIPSMGLDSDGPENPFLLSRYFLVPSVAMALLVVAALARVSEVGRVARMATIVVAGLFVFAIVGDFRLPSRPDLDWPERSACIGGESPCVVPVTIVEVWSIEWPGAAGPYVQPEPALDDGARRWDATP